MIYFIYHYECAVGRKRRSSSKASLLLMMLYILLDIGTEEERRAVEMAYNFSSRKAYFNIYEVEEGDVAMSLDWPNDLKFGDSFDVKVVVTNSSNYKRTLNLKITSTMAFYTGVAGKVLKAKEDTLHLAAKEGTIN